MTATALPYDPQSVRYVQRSLLERAGLQLSPEFERALWPTDTRPREKVVTGGVQAGKSTEGAAEVYIEIPTVDLDRPEPWRYWYIVPTYETPKVELGYLYDWTRSFYGQDSISDHMPEGSSALLSIFGGRILVETRSSMKPESIASQAIDGAVGVESGQQPEAVRTASLERTLTRQGWCVYTGTVEDDEAKPRFAWYSQLAASWEDDWSSGVAISLPTWGNLAVFPEGRQAPYILDYEQRVDQHTFDRRLGGKVRGVRWPVYATLQSVPQMFSSYGMPAGHDRWIYSMGAGGHDFGQGQGGVSPSTLAAGQVNDMGELWIQELRVNFSANTNWIESNRRELSAKWRIPLHRWGFDPMQTEAAEMAHVEVAGRAGSRLAKVGMVEARCERRTIRFNLDGDMVKEGLAQMGRVHYTKVEGPLGVKFEYHRSDDDMAAAVENIVWVLDGKAKPEYVRTSYDTGRASYQPVRGRVS